MSSPSHQREGDRGSNPSTEGSSSSTETQRPRSRPDVDHSDSGGTGFSATFFVPFPTSNAGPSNLSPMGRHSPSPVPMLPDMPGAESTSTPGAETRGMMWTFNLQPNLPGPGLPFTPAPPSMAAGEAPSASSAAPPWRIPGMGGDGAGERMAVAERHPFLPPIPMGMSPFPLGLGSGGQMPMPMPLPLPIPGQLPASMPNTQQSGTGGVEADAANSFQGVPADPHPDFIPGEGQAGVQLGAGIATTEAAGVGPRMSAPLETPGLPSTLQGGDWDTSSQTPNPPLATPEAEARRPMPTFFIVGPDGRAMPIFPSFPPPQGDVQAQGSEPGQPSPALSGQSTSPRSRPLRPLPHPLQPESNPRDTTQPFAGQIPIPFHLLLPLFFRRQDAAPDPEKAKELLKSLQDVPRGMMKRIDRVYAAENMRAVGGEEGNKGAEVNAEKEDGWKCGICLEGYDSDALTSGQMEEGGESKWDTNAGTGIGVKALPCNHLFHSECLEPWFQTKHTCPSCRLDLDPLQTLKSPSVRPAPLRTGPTRSRPGTPAHPYGRPTPAAEANPQPQPGPGSQPGNLQTEVQTGPDGQQTFSFTWHFPDPTADPAEVTGNGDDTAASNRTTQPPSGNNAHPPLPHIHFDPSAGMGGGMFGLPIFASPGPMSQRVSAEQLGARRARSEEPLGSSRAGPSTEHSPQRRMHIDIQHHFMPDGSSSPVPPPELPSPSLAASSAQSVNGSSATSSGPPSGETPTRPHFHRHHIHHHHHHHHPHPHPHFHFHPHPPASMVTPLNHIGPGGSGGASSNGMPFPLPPFLPNFGGPTPSPAQSSETANHPIPGPEGSQQSVPFSFPLPPPAPNHEPVHIIFQRAPDSPAPAHGDNVEKKKFVPVPLAEWIDAKEAALGWRCDAPACEIAPLRHTDPNEEADPFDEIPILQRPKVEDLMGIYSRDQPAPNAMPAAAGEQGRGFVRMACAHRYHPACLSSAERASGRWHDKLDEQVWVRCGTCRKDGWVKRGDVEAEEDAVERMCVEV